jgi:DNA polymerase-1
LNISYVTDRYGLNPLVSELLKENEIYIDTETTGLDVFSCTWLLLQIATSQNIYVLDIRKLDKDLINYVISLIKDSNKRVVAHNAKFDLKIIFNNTKELLTNVYDTMIAEVLINQGVGNQYYSYEYLVEKYIGVAVNKKIRESFIDYEGEITNEQINYASEDILYLKTIKESQVKQLHEQKQITTLDLESKLIPTVISMELNGVKIDENYWRELILENTEKLKNSKEELINYIVKNMNFKKYENVLDLADSLSIPVKTKKDRQALLEISSEFSEMWFRENFNVGSTYQLRKVLNLLGISVDSTGEKVLAPFKNKYEVVDLILKFREYEKQVSTYGENLLVEKHPLTERWHFEYNQLGTYTGRFSVSRMQQIPHEQRFRRAFVARENYSILSSDYSQQEYRLAGALTGEPRIIEAYLLGKDMHTSTASLVYKVSMDSVSSEQRQRAKSINFAVLYGTTAWGLSYNLGISSNEAEELLNLFYSGYPRFKEYKEHAENMIWKLKYSTTPCGRKRYFNDMKSYMDIKEYDKYMRKVKREGWNHMIQGWGADITKIAMNNIFYENPFNSGLYLYNQAHDEIDLEILDDLQKDISRFVEDCMLKAEQPFLKEIPAKVDYRVLKYWSK